MTDAQRQDLDSIFDALDSTGWTPMPDIIKAIWDAATQMGIPDNETEAYLVGRVNAPTGTP